MHRDFSLVCVAKNSTANIIQIILPIQTINFSINKIPLNAFEYLFKDSNHSVRGERMSTYTYVYIRTNIITLLGAENQYYLLILL